VEGQSQSLAEDVGASEVLIRGAASRQQRHEVFSNLFISGAGALWASAYFVFKHIERAGNRVVGEVAGAVGGRRSVFFSSATTGNVIIAIVLELNHLPFA